MKENIDIISQKNILETENHRILVEDTDEGEELRERVHDLKQLVAAYQLGWIPETRVRGSDLVKRVYGGTGPVFVKFLKKSKIRNIRVNLGKTENNKQNGAGLCFFVEVVYNRIAVLPRCW